MEKVYDLKMKELGYNQLVTDIFLEWENVKDEILLKERKSGTGSGTVHVFLGAADEELRQEFASYYDSVDNGEDPSVGAIPIRHYFIANNVLSMIGYLCQYYQTQHIDFSMEVKSILDELTNTTDESGLITTTSLFKLSTGSNRLRPYFKQFDEKGVFYRIIRHLLQPKSAYKISLYKNEQGEYAAFWLIGFDYLSNFEANSSKAVFKQEIENNPTSLQQIFYGAPGTGKSHAIKKEVDEKGKQNFRITFHPDSDYSTFVGCYKPTMKSPEKEYSPEELVVKLKEIKLSGVSYPCHKFAAQYWKSVKKLSNEQIKQLLLACDFTESMNVEVAKGIAVGEDLSSKTKDEQIVYRFVPQAFTKAYTAAWNTEDDVYLIIEEINRGNCAQIFGDLFQLLDRKNGVSQYPIDADTDLADYIAKELANSPRTDFPEKVKEGKKLVLPSNLYIWATMNTSDQSLFPIDSAFKRRWDWKYLKIKDHPDQHYRIKLNDEVEYDWYAFVERINQIIASMTSSADKQLGYFFCKADGDGIIKADTFVAKVIFYLWNDVFKDYGFEDTSLFTFTEVINGKEETRELTFPDFYDKNGEKVNETRLKGFIDSVMNWKNTTEENH